MTEPVHPRDRGTRAIDLSVEVPGTPEEVWETIATGPGISSWFVPHEVDEREGGQVTMDFGTFGTEQARVTVWDPPRRVEFCGDGDHGLAFEWLVESREGGTCVVRLVNSGFGDGEHWDGQYDGMTEGWQLFLHNLRLQLTHHRGERCRAVVPTVTMAGPNLEAWKDLCSALGVSDSLDAGDPIRTGSDVPTLGGRVDTVHRTAAARAYVLVVDDPVPGTAFITVEGDGNTVAGSVYTYLYGETGTGQDLASWLVDRYPPMTAELSADSFPGSR